MLNNFTIEILCDKVREDIKKTVAFFRQGADKEGYKQLVELIKPMEELIQLSAKDGKVKVVEKINLDLLKALKAMEDGDLVLLADYLEYQILPNITSL